MSTYTHPYSLTIFILVFLSLAYSPLHSILFLHFPLLLFLVGFVFFLYKLETDPHYTLKFSPTRISAKILGIITSIYIPRFLRRPIYERWGKKNKINFEEIVDNLEDFKTFREFFTRKVTPRPIDKDPNTIVSPCEGRITHITEITQDVYLDIKRIEYKVGELFTGLPGYEFNPEVVSKLKYHKENSMYLYKIYLSKANYHRYHAPCDMVVKARNHIAGHVRTVDPVWEISKRHIYEVNERVVIYGEWAKGFIAVAFIAATWEVGSMTLNFDPQLDTRKILVDHINLCEVKEFPGGQVTNDVREKGRDVMFKKEGDGVRLAKGDEVGRFLYGSTIVVLFEGKEMDWKLMPGDFVRYGQGIGVTK